MGLGLSGKTVLVIGASRGIGEGIAQAFAAQGCALRLGARSAEDLDRVVAGLRQRHGAAVQALAVDMTLPGAVAELAAFAGDVDESAGAVNGS